MSSKFALITFTTGVTGQDGAHLSEFFLSKGYVVHAIKRCISFYLIPITSFSRLGRMKSKSGRSKLCSSFVSRAGVCY